MRISRGKFLSFGGVDKHPIITPAETVCSSRFSSCMFCQYRSLSHSKSITNPRPLEACYCLNRRLGRGCVLLLWIAIVTSQITDLATIMLCSIALGNEDITVCGWLDLAHTERKQWERCQLYYVWLSRVDGSGSSPSICGVSSLSMFASCSRHVLLLSFSYNSIKKPTEPEDATALFGPPLDTAFDDIKSEGTFFIIQFGWNNYTLWY